MNCRTFLLIVLFFILNACNQYDQKNKEIKFTVDQKYKNTGFALVYNESLKKNKKIAKKLDNRSLKIFHKSLKKNSFVKITNPVNDKSIIAEVVSNNVKFSEFYNSVISLRIAENLSLNLNEPYINLILISQNSTFIAKKAKTFDEEKKVADIAPVDSISINNLNDTNKKKTKKIIKSKFVYIIKIADFYFKNSAKSMSDRIKKETPITNVRIKSLSNTQYRVFLGPFNNINSLQKAFNDISTLEFENIEIIKDDKNN